MSDDEIRVVVAIDFGTTCSGFAYSHVSDREITCQYAWPGPNNTRTLFPKVRTMLQYDESWSVVAWGESALAREIDFWDDNEESVDKVATTTLEYFKLHLAGSEEEKPYLPKGFDYRKAIKDFLKKMMELVKETLTKRWQELEMSQVRFVFTIPAQWQPEEIGIFQNCIYATEIVKDNLEFTTEPEAAALYCLSKMDDHNLSTGDLFLVVDSGGGTVDLTMRVILEDRKIGEITERSSALCGSTYVDRNFIAFLEEKFGKDAIKKFKENHYQEYQYLIHNFFCQHVKFGYTGEQTAFKKFTLDFTRFCPKLKEYVNCGNIRMSFDDIKNMFDPVVETIINLIKDQLSGVSQRCSAIFLVGGFSESYYLTKRIEDEFKNTVPYICVSPKPITSVVRGAVMYGLNKSVIKYRILTMYYGVEIYPKWEKTDPKSRRTTDDRIYKFSCLAKRGQKIELDRKCSGTYVPIYPDQKSISFKVFASPKYAEYCDDPGMRKIGNLHVNLPDVELGLYRPVEFSLMFGELAITAVAVNKKNGNFYTAVFNYVKSDFDLESF